MRLVVRPLSVGFWQAWARVLSASISAGALVWPFFGSAVLAGARARRRLLGVLLGSPVAVGWPALVWVSQPHAGHRSSLLALAVPWWVILGGYSFVALMGRIGHAASLREARAVQAGLGGDHPAIEPR
jgi:hypothetical protein